MCGIVGFYPGSKKSRKQIVTILVMALHALQHRGQDSCGLAIVIDNLIQIIKSNGTIGHAWSKKKFKSLECGSLGLGHVRYPTAGKKGGSKVEQIQNAQPFQIHLKGIGGVALVHNGTISNANKYRKKILATGQKFRSDTDSEVALRMLSLETGSLEKRLKKVCRKLEGGFSFILITRKKLLGVRGPHGFWPLVIGEKGKSFMLASETSALEANEFKYVREIQPGEIIVINKKGVKNSRIKKPAKVVPCIFELVYFSRPDSITFGRSVSLTRMAIGKFLARKYPLKADMVCPVPDSGMSAAIGYAQESEIPYMPGIIRNHYEEGRAFLKRTTYGRKLKSQMKLPIDRSIVEGKIIILIDDSIVRGNTLAVTIKRLYKAGAKKVHVLITCPPVRHPCLVGIDTPTYEELFAHGCQTVKQVCKKAAKKFGVTSFNFISIKDLHKSCGAVYKKKNSDFCDACFTGNYPVKIPV